MMDNNYGGQDSSRDDGDRGPRRRRGGGRFGRFGMRPKKVVEPKEPLNYKNVSYLQSMVGPTGKIMSRRRTGFSGQNQRKLASAVKLARFIGLLPYVGNASPGDHRGDYRGDRGDHRGDHRSHRRD